MLQAQSYPTLNSGQPNSGSRQTNEAEQVRKNREAIPGISETGPAWTMARERDIYKKLFFLKRSIFYFKKVADGVFLSDLIKMATLGGKNSIYQSSAIDPGKGNTFTHLS